MDDRTIAAGFLQGDVEAATIVDQWLARASSSFRRSLAEDWDDLQQELRMEMLQLLREGRYRGESSLKTFTWQVAVHSCLDAVRRKRHRPAAGDDLLDHSLQASDPSPFDSLVEAERTQRLWMALQAMSQECRALWRFILDGLSYKEIAVRLAVTEGALRVRAHRCCKRAEESLAGNDAPRETPK